jgi:hypothetical protein
MNNLFGVEIGEGARGLLSDYEDIYHVQSLVAFHLPHLFELNQVSIPA